MSGKITREKLEAKGFRQTGYYGGCVVFFNDATKEGVLWNSKTEEIEHSHKKS